MAPAVKQPLRRLFLCAVCLALSPLHAGDAPLSIVETTLLSTTGSTRATAYGMSHKIVTTPTQVVVGWLDQPAEIMVRAFNRQARSWSPAQKVGTGMSNHAGPALTKDSTGRIHLVFGPHHGPFTYRHTLRAGEIDKWSEPESFGFMGTYPSLVTGPDDTLHLTYRSSGSDPWRVLYQQRPAGGTWSEPLALFENDVPGYMWTGHSLAVDAAGTLHVVFCLYEEEAKRGRAILYLRSPDGGSTWLETAGAEMLLPVRAGDASTILADPTMDVRVKSMVLGPRQEPWFVTVHLGRPTRTVVLRSLEAGSWTEIDLLPHLQAVDPNRELVDATMTFDRDGRLYVFATTGGVGPEVTTFWGDPSNEVVLLVSADRGQTFSVLPVSVPDPTEPAWMPSIERPLGPVPIGRPHLLYTRGGPGTGVHSPLTTEVHFITLGP